MVESVLRHGDPAERAAGRHEHATNDDDDQSRPDVWIDQGRPRRLRAEVADALLQLKQVVPRDPDRATSAHGEHTVKRERCRSAATSSSLRGSTTSNAARLRSQLSHTTDTCGVIGNRSTGGASAWTSGEATAGTATVPPPFHAAGKQYPPLRSP